MGDNQLLSLVDEFETQIRKLNLESFDSATLLESQHKLYTIISQMKFSLNSRAQIHQLSQDILYDILTRVVLGAGQNHYYSMMTLLTVSHVCQHWRNSALGWRKLWGLVDLSKSRNIIELFVSRTKDAPLDLFAAYGHFAVNHKLKLNLNSCSNRLRRLTLNFQNYPDQTVKTQLHDPELQPLQLEHLEVTARKTLHGRQRSIPPLTDFIRLDVSCLQSLSLYRTHFPLLELPHDNVLTRFIVRQGHPPVLSQLLVFLSRCPLLRELELDITVHYDDLETLTLPSQLTISRLDFPKLDRLALHTNWDSSLNISCFNYMRELSARIGTMGLLSSFSLSYGDFFHGETDVTILPPSNIFGLVPPETFGHFSDHFYLSIFLNAPSSKFRVFSQVASKGFLPSLSLQGTWGPGQPIDRSIVELVYAMPKLTHLALRYDAFKLFFSWDLNFHDAFPCLNTLEFDYDNHDDSCQIALTSLPKKLSKIKKLIICTNYLPPQVLLDVVSDARVETLQLEGIKGTGSRFEEFTEVISAMRKMGVVVVT